ncbi:MAG: hypothetical protein AB8I08_07930 [Sandaracinaceae bacterium]
MQKTRTHSCAVFALAMAISACSSAADPSDPSETGNATSGADAPAAEGYVIEVTTFRQNEAMSPDAFSAADAEIEASYTSQQPGFLGRISARSEEGEWAVVVYWETTADADASMQRFMQDASVADYAAAIDPESMQMSRYRSSGEHTPSAAPPVLEVTRFGLAASVDPETFAVRDGEIEASYTSAQPGFLRRGSGVNDDGEWVVVVDWEDTGSAEASMARFMSTESVSDYAAMIDGEGMSMARYLAP